MGWQISLFYPKRNYFHSDMSNSTNTVVCFDWKTVIYIYVCGQCRTQFMLPNSSRRQLVNITTGKSVTYFYDVVFSVQYTYVYSILNIKMRVRKSHSGLPREILQGWTRLLCDPGNRLIFLSKLRILGPIKPLVNFQKCFISCAAECPDKITLCKTVTNTIPKSKRIFT